MAVTRAQIRRELGRRLGHYHEGTPTGSSTTALLDASTDARLKASAILDASLWEGSWIYRPDSTASSDNVRMCVTYAPTDGTLAPGFAWTAAPSTAESFELIGQLHPDQIHDAIERAARGMYYETYEPLTLVTDGSMESTATSDWTASGATLAKDTDAADNVEIGSRSLSVSTTAANGYAQSTSLRVEGGKTYQLWCDVRAPGATADVEAIDITNSNNVLKRETYTDGEWGVVDFSFTPPGDCDQIAVRLGADEISKTVHFDNLIVSRSERTVFNLPSWLTNPKRWVYQLLDGTTTGRPRHRRWQQSYGFGVLDDPTAANPAQIVVEQPAVMRPLFVRAIRPFLSDTGTLATDATQLDCNLDWITKRAEVQVYDLMRVEGSQTQGELWTNRYTQALIDAQAQDRLWMPERPPEAY